MAQGRRLEPGLEQDFESRNQKEHVLDSPAENFPVKHVYRKRESVHTVTFGCSRGRTPWPSPTLGNTYGSIPSYVID